MRAAVFSFALVLMCGAANAPAPRPPSDNEVSAVTVMPPTAPPKVAATFPAVGGTAAPGVTVISITFDQAMLKTGFDFSPAPQGDLPECLKTPRLLADGRTFALLCRTLPGKSYALMLNAKAAGGFVNPARQRAERFSLTFTTGTDGFVVDLDGALKAAKLGPIDVPVEEQPDTARKDTTTPAP